jgi:hypothetical protein
MIVNTLAECMLEPGVLQYYTRNAAKYMIFEVLTAANVTVTILWDMKPCLLRVDISVSEHVGEQFLHIWCSIILSTAQNSEVGQEGRSS